MRHHWLVGIIHSLLRLAARALLPASPAIARVQGSLLRLQLPRGCCAAASLAAVPRSSADEHDASGNWVVVIALASTDADTVFTAPDAAATAALAAGAV